MKTSGASATALAYVTTLFFAWGFVTSLIDPLIASVRGVFELTFAEAMLTQFAWFIAYAVASLPAAYLVARLGYATSIVSALVAMVAGCALIPIATALHFYPGVLIALFVIASGVTWLQVAANPLAASLGQARTSHLRLMFSQAFNSLGTVVGPYLGATIMLSGGVFATAAAVSEASKAESLRAIDTAFVMIGVFFALLAVFIWTARKRLSAASLTPPEASAPWLAFRSGWAVFGALAIFLYVGSEVAIGSLMTNYLHHDAIMGLPIEEAGKLVSIYWLGAMIGRFVGSALLVRVPAGVLLSVAALVAAAACAAITQLAGPTAGYAALGVGVFNSIMFPAIFTLTLERSTAPQAATSGLLCMAIVGGAVLPLMAGMVADNAPAIGMAFVVPLAGYLGIAVFAIAAARSKPNTPLATRSTAVSH